jgi:hypothetical protein
MVLLLFWIGILHEIIVVRHFDGQVPRIAMIETQSKTDERQTVCMKFGLEKSLQVLYLSFFTSHQQLNIYTSGKIR